MNLTYRNGVYLARWRAHGKQFTRSTGVRDERCRAEALAKGFELKREVDEGYTAYDQKRIEMIDGYSVWLSAPRPLSTSRAQERQVQRAWSDWCDWLDEVHPTLRYADEVSHVMAREYARKVAQCGIQGSRIKTLSARSVNAYVGHIRNVFGVLSDELGIDNPFKRVQSRRERPVTRDVFTERELTKLFADQDGMVASLTILGAYTGLRAGDLCRLDWRDVDLDADVIRTKTGKTGVNVVIPILPPVKALLWRIGPAKHGPVVPEAQELYENHRDQVTGRFKAAMDRAGISHQSTPDDGSRTRSVKGMHALRHTFVYLCARSGVPMVAVQRAVGHVTPKMTEHYANHASEQAIKEMIKLPDLREKK